MSIEYFVGRCREVEARRDLGSVRQSYACFDLPGLTAIGTTEPMILPSESAFLSSIEDQPPGLRHDRPAACISDEYLDVPSAPHDFNVMIADHAELAAVARLVIGVGRDHVAERQVAPEWQRRQQQAGNDRGDATRRRQSCRLATSHVTPTRIAAGT